MIDVIIKLIQHTYTYRALTSPLSNPIFSFGSSVICLEANESEKPPQFKMFLNSLLLRKMGETCPDVSEANIIEVLYL